VVGIVEQERSDIISDYPGKLTPVREHASEQNETNFQTQTIGSSKIISLGLNDISQTLDKSWMSFNTRIKRKGKKGKKKKKAINNYSFNNTSKIIEIPEQPEEGHQEQEEELQPVLEE